MTFLRASERSTGGIDAPLDASTDEQLMLLLRDGADSALTELVERYQNDVFRFCLHYVRHIEVAKELAQETFLRVYAARGRFDTARLLKPWMLCIARNLCLNELKRGKIAPMDSLEQLAAAGAAGKRLSMSEETAIPSDELMARERRTALMRLLDALPVDARELVTMRFFEHMPAREIAAVVDSTEGAVRTRLHRVLKELREQYAPMKEDL